MNVPRGTTVLDGTPPLWTFPGWRQKVRPLLFRADMRTAIYEGVKDTTRRVVGARNSLVHPGSFEGLDLETGRARHYQHPEIRARCTFESGSVRPVSVTSAVRVGDGFWVKTGRTASRAASTHVLDVIQVDVGRVQDMTDAEALREGVPYIPEKFRRTGAPRDWFARLWDDINGPGSWDSNPWVWIYRFRPYRANINDVEANIARKKA